MKKPLVNKPLVNKRPAASLSLFLSIVLLPLLLLLGCDSGSDDGPEQVFGVEAQRDRIAIGSSVGGTLEASAPRILNLSADARQRIFRGTFLRDSSHVNVYRVETEGPTQLRLTSPDFDTYLVVLNAVGDVVRFDDNGFTASNAQLIYTPGTEGPYYALVTSFSQNETGMYTLSSRSPEEVPLGVPVEQAIARGRTVTGALETTDARLTDLNDEITGGDIEDDLFIDVYSVSGAGDVTVNVQSNEFDTVVVLISEFGSVLNFDDDSGPETNSRLSFTLGTGERVYVLVSSFFSFETGAYTLSASGTAALRLDSAARTQREGRSSQKGTWGTGCDGCASSKSLF